jgi:hypothetical protein
MASPAFILAEIQLNCQGVGKKFLKLFLKLAVQGGFRTENYRLLGKGSGNNSDFPRR